MRSASGSASPRRVLSVANTPPSAFSCAMAARTPRITSTMLDPTSCCTLIAMTGAPELRTKPVNRYLPPRKKDAREEASLLAPLLELEARGFAGWLDRMLGKMG
jgi:hypothetical protein